MWPKLIIHYEQQITHSQNISFALIQSTPPVTANNRLVNGCYDFSVISKGFRADFNPTPNRSPPRQVFITLTRISGTVSIVPLKVSKFVDRLFDVTEWKIRFSEVTHRQNRTIAPIIIINIYLHSDGIAFTI